MNIALVHDWITNVSGAERVLLAIKDIFPEAVIYTSVYKEDSAQAFSDFEIRTTYLQNYPVFQNRREALIPYAPLAFESLDLSNFDLVISNTTFAAKGIITKPETVHICYCHTPTRYLWEQQIDSRASQGRFSGVRRRISNKLRVWDYAAAQRPDYFIANSETVRKRIKKYYNRDSKVVYPPVETNRFHSTASDTVSDYYLYVSRLVDYKRADIVVEAFNINGRNLRIVGNGPEKAKLMARAKNNIKFLNHVSDQELLSEYQNAKAFVFASEEDFGIVPVEAMACGKPVICYGTGGASETVLNGKTGLYFFKQSAVDINEAIEKFESLALNKQTIIQRAEEFSEQKFKKNFRESVEKFVSEHRTNFL
jgi:glycosyltransferase involved in cell wall biosynthesis